MVSGVDHPDLPEHHYLEGYFHTLPTMDDVLSANPRSGHGMQKPAASARLRAFGEALRQVNSPLLEELALACPEGGEQGFHLSTAEVN